MMTTLLVLAFIGILLISAEIFLPGGILGVAGAVFLVVSFVLGYREFGFYGGSSFVVGNLLLVTVVIVVEVKLLKNSPLAKSFFLNTVIARESSETPHPKAITSDLIGKDAVALTNLAPAGLVDIGGASYDAVSQDGFIRKGEDLKVVRQDKSRLFVRVE